MDIENKNNVPNSNLKENYNDCYRLLCAVKETMEELKENGSFYNSAIEFEHGFDGIEFKEEFEFILTKLREYCT